LSSLDQVNIAVEGFPAYELAQKQYLTFIGGQNK